MLFAKNAMLACDLRLPFVYEIYCLYDNFDYRILIPLAVTIASFRLISRFS